MAQGYGSEEKPGVKARRQQLAEAMRERNQYQEEAGSPVTGNVETRTNVSRARRNLDRMLKALAKKRQQGE